MEGEVSRILASRSGSQEPHCLGDSLKSRRDVSSDTDGKQHPRSCRFDVHVVIMPGLSICRHLEGKRDSISLVIFPSSQVSI